MLDQLDQMQETSPALLPSLSALLAHPRFQEGLRCGYEEFEGSYQPAPLTEEKMIDDVEQNLSHRACERDEVVRRVMGLEHSSYLFNLGFVVATIDQGLSDALPSARVEHDATMEVSAETPTRGILHQINLGQHHLLIMEDQSIQLACHDESEQPIQVLSLESTEAYRLMLCLQDLFKSMGME